jgi:hypothetical protein
VVRAVSMPPGLAGGASFNVICAVSRPEPSNCFTFTDGMLPAGRNRFVLGATGLLAGSFAT